MTICTECQASIIEACTTWAEHQVSGLDCVICSRLRQHGSQTSDVDVLPGLYWWKLRPLVHSREIPRSYSLVFTPNTLKYPAFKDVPARTFYLFEKGSVRTPSKLERRTDSPGTLHQMKSWLKQCEGPQHSRCFGVKKPSWKPPTRLLDIGTTSTDKIIVIETASHSEIIHKYTTLSHCWGKEGSSPPILKLMKKEGDHSTDLAGHPFTDPKQGIEWSKLPENFQEAIQVTRQLGVRYIWIDALCIVQGPNGDFDHEGQLMHRVYRNSFCNLTASDSRDGSGGLFRSRETEKLIPTSFETSDTSLFGLGSWIILASDIWDDQLLGQPLYERGWVFQERILSPRMLHFTKDQVFWDCASMSACEILPDGLPNALDVAAASERHWRARLQITEEGKIPTGSADDSLERFWKNAVRSYTACVLSQNKDRMVAIWSVAKLVRDEMRRDYKMQDYGAGLWSWRLHAQLAWRVMNPAKAERVPELNKYPTWSWASLIGEVEVQDRGPVENRLYSLVGHDGQDLRFKLKEVTDEQRRTVAPGANDFQEELKTNSLAMKVKLFQVTIHRTEPLLQLNNNTTPSPPPQADHYTLRTEVSSSLPGFSLPEGDFEVFLDTKEFDINEMFYFIVLDASKVELGSSAMGVRSTRSDGTAQGTGLILTKALLAEHELEFNRVAMCRFQGISDTDWKLLTPESGAGTDIWLT